MSVSWRAPGRVNLIGEHTDYNDGFVLPFALDLGCTATVSQYDEAVVHIRSAQEDEPVTLALGDLAPGEGGWAGYVAGVVWALRERDALRLADGTGLDVVVDSDVPAGSGLSSSAALVCSVATALDELLGLHLDPAALLEVSRVAENDFVGAPTGGMDQLASLRCREGNALFCDMRSLEVDQVPFDVAAKGLAVLVIDSRTEHRHADGEYRRRREGCERAARELGVSALRDIGVDDLDDALAKLSDDELRRYVRHVVTEDDRVLRTVDLLRDGQIRAIGELMVASHASMRDDYRITTPELDAIVDTMLAEGAAGARMTGGGFGGCAIALVDTDAVDRSLDALTTMSTDRGFPRPRHWTVRPAAGAHPV